MGLNGQRIPANPAPPVAPARPGGPSFVDRATQGASDLATRAGDALGQIPEKAKGFWDELTKTGGLGKILGGIIGLGGAWFLGNFFGDGIIGTVLTIALAFPLMCIGSEKLGSMFNGWMGTGGNQQPGRGQQLQPGGPLPIGYNQNQQQGSVLTQEGLNAAIAQLRAAGGTAETIRIGTPGHEVRVRTAELQQDLNEARRVFGPNSGLMLTPQGNSVTPTAIPLQPNTSYQGR